ncbi:MAG TPA: hypothetical protein VFN74_07425 [Chloroflexota bacterium]|nr:hypothetical protein [Chloroflexota bacterium]
MELSQARSQAGRSASTPDRLDDVHDVHRGTVLAIECGSTFDTP